MASRELGEEVPEWQDLHVLDHSGDVRIVKFRAVRDEIAARMDQWLSIAPSD